VLQAVKSSPNIQEAPASRPRRLLPLVNTLRIVLLPLATVSLASDKPMLIPAIVS
jgi:hypothetical protein